MEKTKHVVNLYNEQNKKRTHYVNNKDLWTAIVEYKAKVAECAEKGLDKPRPPEYIGHCIKMICEKLFLRKNFRGYSYKDDMIGDGIIDCVSAVKNFDPNKSKYPFTYFSKVAYFAFIRRIESEKVQSYVKHNGVNRLVDEGMSESEMESLGYVRNDQIDAFLDAFETKKNLKNRKTKRKA